MKIVNNAIALCLCTLIGNSPASALTCAADRAEIMERGEVLGEQAGQIDVNAGEFREIWSSATLCMVGRLKQPHSPVVVQPMPPPLFDGRTVDINAVFEHAWARSARLVLVYPDGPEVALPVVREGNGFALGLDAQK